MTEKVHTLLMTKKKRKSPDKFPKQPPPMPEPERNADAAADVPSEYGGLPARDLKKNLGCG